MLLPTSCVVACHGQAYSWTDIMRAISACIVRLVGRNEKPISIAMNCEEPCGTATVNARQALKASLLKAV
jgi:hypothetical protein